MTSDGVAMFRELGADFYGLGGPTSLRMRNTGNSKSLHKRDGYM